MLNVNEIRAEARQKTIAAIMPSLMDSNAIKFADGCFAIKQEVDGQCVWVEVTVKTKAWKDTKKTKAFNPFTVAAEWEVEKKLKNGSNKER